MEYINIINNYFIIHFPIMINNIEAILQSMTIKQTDGTRSDVYTSDEIEEGAWVTQTKKITHNNTPILNQHLVNDPITTNACGAYSATKIINEMNFIEWSYPGYICDPVEFWKKTLSNFYGNINSWSSLQGNTSNACYNKHISGYYKCVSVQAMKTAIDKWDLISTWSKYVDRAAVLWSSDSVLRFIDKPKYWHLFCIINYDDNLHGWVFIIANSSWDWVLDKWLCYVKYSDIWKFYSRIAFVDKKDGDRIDKVTEDRSLIASALENKIWNWLKADNPVLFWEYKLMSERLWFTWPFNWVYEDKLTRTKLVYLIVWMTWVNQQIIWNKTNPNNLATRYQAVLMLMRAKNSII